MIGFSLRQDPALSIVIPMYCESKRIGPTLEDIATTLSSWDLLAEVVVVDDGSTDDTRAVAEAAGERLFGDDGSVDFVCVALERNRGKGAAVCGGLEVSRGAWVLMMDADNSARLCELPKLMAATRDDRVGMVVGSRSMPESEIQSRFLRRASGLVFQSAVRMMGMRFVSDSQCGFKFYRRDAALLCAEHGVEEGFAFDLEHLGLCEKRGIGIREVGIAWMHSPNGTVNVFTDGVSMLLRCMRIRNRLRRLPISSIEGNGAAPMIEFKWHRPDGLGILDCDVSPDEGIGQGTGDRAVQVDAVRAGACVR